MGAHDLVNGNTPRQIADAIQRAVIDAETSARKDGIANGMKTVLVSDAILTELDDLRVKFAPANPGERYLREDS